MGVRVEAVRIVEDEVRELIRRRGLDPLRESGEVRRLVEAAVSDYDERALLAPLPPLGPLESARRFVFDAVAGFGALQPLLDDPGIEEIWLNAPNEIYVARNGESELTSVSLTDQQVRDLVERMLTSSGRRLDMSSPFVDAALPDGSRLHVVIPDVTRRHWAINIRKFVVKASRLEHLVELGTLTPQAARFLGAAVASGLNILVSGATQAGKTTMLNCLAASIGTRERVITVEEIFELQLPLRDVVGLQCRQPNLEGQGEIPLRRLVKEALRMRPDRLVVGEVREAESLDMLIALNSGLPYMTHAHYTVGCTDVTYRFHLLPHQQRQNRCRARRQAAGGGLPPVGGGEGVRRSSGLRRQRHQCLFGQEPPQLQRHVEEGCGWRSGRSFLLAPGPSPPASRGA